MRCHDKLESRRLQREAVPDATPRFFALDPSDPIPDPLPLPFPLFVKPVSAHLSQLAFPVNDRHAARGRAAIGPRAARSGRGVRRGAGGTLVPPDARRGAARRTTRDVRRVHARRVDDAGRRHRLGDASERHQLRPVRLPERASSRGGRPPGRDRRRAHAGARLRRLAVQHRVLRHGRRDREDRRGERTHGVAVRAARAGRARHVDVPDPARAGDRRTSDAPGASPRRGRVELRAPSLRRGCRRGGRPRPDRGHGPVPRESGRGARSPGPASVGQRRRLREPSAGGGRDVRPRSGVAPS